MDGVQYIDRRCQAKDGLLRAIASNQKTDAIVQQLKEGQTLTLLRVRQQIPHHQDWTSASNENIRSRSVKDESMSVTNREEEE